MIKLFASDLDGTLLNAQHDTDDIILSCVKDILHQGKQFAVSTGRNLQGVIRNQALCELPIYIIANNGALILDAAFQTIYEKTISEHALLKLMEMAPIGNPEFISRDHVYMLCTREEHEVLFLEKQKRRGMKFMDNPKERWQEMTSNYVYEADAQTILEAGILKVNCHGECADDLKVIDACIASLADEIINAPFQSDVYELTDKHVNKGFGVEKLMKILNIDREEVAVFGDGGNDVEMLKRFPHSYAMENGVDDAKAAATYQIGHNEDYAVIKKIRELLEVQ